MRKKGSTASKMNWEVIIRQKQNDEWFDLHNKQYKTLQDAADDLGLTYNQMFEFTSKGRHKKRQTKFKFYPDICIRKLCECGDESEKINQNNISEAEIEN